MYDPRMSGFGYEYRDADSSPSHRYLLPVILDFLKDLPPGATVLDVGCGNGTLTAKLAKRGWHVYGTDFSPTGIEYAQKTFPEITFFLADAQKSGSLQDYGPFDAVLSAEVIEHVYDPRGLARTLFDQVKPGGQAILSTPYHGYLKNVVLALTGKLDQHFTVLWDHGHIKFFSRKTLTKVLEEAGFRDVEFQGAGRLPYLWMSMVLRCRRPAD